jgi:hypothetical protein
MTIDEVARAVIGRDLFIQQDVKTLGLTDGCVHHLR